MAKAIKRIHGIEILKKRHPLIKRMRKRLPYPAIHGDQVWSSSFLIMDYLLHYPVKSNKRIMEIGCGWGLLSIFCAQNFEAKVTATDADPNVFAYLKLHALLNGVKVKTKCRRYEKIGKKELAGQYMLLGGDICFWDKLVEPLYKVIDKSLKSGVKRVVIADPGRSPFMRLAKRCKKRLGGELLEWEVDSPKQSSGYLLVIEKGG